MEEKKLTKHRLARIAIVICIVAIFFCGCTEEMTGDNHKHNVRSDGMDSLETEPDLSYVVPEIVPKILVSQKGYIMGGQKEVIFRGNKLPNTFDVIDMESGKSVYTGKIDNRGYNEKLGEYIGYGEINSLDEQGNYYIQGQMIGQSYAFAITEDVYKDLMKEALTGVTLETEIDIVERCRIIAALLLSYELFPQVHEDGILYTKNDIPDILDYIELEIQKLSEFQDEQTGEVGEATAWFSAVMAKFSYTYQKHDSVRATKCLQLADKAWKYMEKNKDSIIPAEYFFAATEMYRATGKYAYHATLKELGKSITPTVENEAYIYGGITYIATKRNVDVDLCSDFLKKLMERAEEVCASSKEAPFLVNTAMEESEEEFLKNMTVMSLVDYVITNHEYATVIENHHYYLLGRNSRGKCYVGSGELWENKVYVSQYIIMLSEVMSH